MHHSPSLLLSLALWAAWAPEDWEEPWKDECGSVDSRGPLQLSASKKRGGVMRTHARAHVELRHRLCTAQAGSKGLWSRNLRKPTGAKGAAAISYVYEF